MKTELCKKEKQFCLNFINTGNIKEAAINAGYVISPVKSAIKLISKESINNEITRLYEEKKKKSMHMAYSGYERLAFGSITDAVRLLYIENPDITVLQEMDLFNISEIKKPKDGSMEIKFFDRFKALEKLEQAELSGTGQTEMFYKALEQGVQSLNNEEE